MHDGRSTSGQGAPCAGEWRREAASQPQQERSMAGQAFRRRLSEEEVMVVRRRTIRAQPIRVRVARGTRTVPIRVRYRVTVTSRRR